MPQRRILSSTFAGVPRPRRRFPRAPRGKLRSPAWWARVALSSVVVLFLFGSALTAWVTKDLPQPGSLTDRRVRESTKIYDRTGTTLLYEVGEVRRTRVKLADVSPHMIAATIAAEDRDFFTHRGFAVRGILRAVSRIRPGRRFEGGSTITQQLVKNALLTPERTLVRKLREFLLAVAIEGRYTKEEILEIYLNEIPYGANAYGIEAAARVYFGTTAKDLSLAQASLLAALPKAPTYYSPYGSNRDELIARQQWILEGMRETGKISESEAAAAKRVQFSFPSRRTESILAPHFVFYVRELLAREFGETQVEQGGLKVTTTLDLALERAAEEAIAAQAPKNRAYDARNAALVTLDPRTGDILAMVGSVDYFDEDNDGNVNVATRPRSPGSSFKPIVYAEAFRRGFTPETILADVPIEFAAAGKSYAPKNFDLKFRGPVTMRQALAQSLNVPSVQALYLAGVEEAVALARRMGFTTLADPERYGLSLVLGGGEVRLLDEVSAYGVFAREGIRVPHRAILKVTAPNGDILFDASEKELTEERVLEPEIARLVTNILSDNAARAPVFGAASPLQLGERPVAAKTGTAQEFRDGWTIGYTPSLVAGVWVGNNDNTPMKREPGAYTAAPIWNTFIRAALAGTPVEHFTPPERKETGNPILDGKIPQMTVRYERDTGLVLPASCNVALGVPRRFVEFRSVLHYVARENPRGGPPEDPAREPQYRQWEDGIAAWREKDNTERPDDEVHYVEKLPESSCDLSALEGRPIIRFLLPSADRLTRSPARVRVEVEAPEPVTRLEFFADDKSLGDRTSPPWETLYRFPPSQHGEITLRIRATTERGKKSEVRKKVLVNPDTTLPRVELRSPRAGETLPPSRFPFSLAVRASDPSGIAEVDVLYALAGEKRLIRIGRAATPSEAADRFNITWESAPSPGTYELRARAKDTTGNLATTTPVRVVVP